MAEYELAELIVLHAEAATDIFSIFLTIISAYLIAAFVGGTRLARSQAIILNSMFVVSSLVSSYRCVEALRYQLYYTEKLKLIAPDSPHTVSVAFLYVISVVFLVAILASIKFMWDIRHHRAD
jgi:hypothetical protein